MTPRDIRTYLFAIAFAIAFETNLPTLQHEVDVQLQEAEKQM